MTDRKPTIEQIANELHVLAVRADSGFTVDAGELDELADSLRSLAAAPAQGEAKPTWKIVHFQRLFGGAKDRITIPFNDEPTDHVEAKLIDRIEPLYTHPAPTPPQGASEGEVRARFEAWAGDLKWNVGRCDNGARRYATPAVDFMWLGYRAALLGEKS